MEPVDVILLTHDRLGHLVATVEALRARTRDVPIRLTVVDNASGPEVRTWLVEHRGWFHGVIPRAANEHVPGFQHGIDATTSDPFVVTDPDLVVPDVEPSWLARMLALLERHPDFGLVGVELDPSNSPLSAEEVAALRGERAGDRGAELREGNVGTHLQLVRRDALREPYRSDRQVCDAVRRAGYRVGWAPEVRALHLGFEDARANPEYLRAKDARGEFYPSYANVLAGVEEAPSLRALAAAAPVVAATRALGIADDEVEDRCGVLAPLGRGPLRPARAVVTDDPAAVRAEGEAVVLVTTLPAVGGRLADELAPPGWRGAERAGVGDAVLALAEAADTSPVIRARLGLNPLQHREDWLRLLAAGAFGATARRVFVFTPDA
ncbi:MAG TPA: glycosyltransferase [Solirubrobacteraceae bacterium]|nr:glycosyltransferase [Solirubrobacteraceae bacterium]